MLHISSGRNSWRLHGLNGAKSWHGVAWLDEKNGLVDADADDPLLICYIAMEAMEAMALIEIEWNRWFSQLETRNLHLWLGFSMANC